MLLRLHNIARFYGPRLIFKDVSLTLRRGTVTLLAGANGAGKSTLLKIMAGLIRPSSGHVELVENKSGTTPAVGYLGHQTFLYPDLSALENLRFWAGLYGSPLPEGAFTDILERVELSPFAEEKTKGFSRGMAQRLNLAMVFLLKPKLLLLDEPGTGLDTRSTAMLHREIATAREAGAAVAWITHSLDADLCRADMVALLQGKRLNFYDTPEEYRTLTEAASDKTPVPDSWQTRRAQGGEPC